MISVIVCTCDRAAALGQCLAHFDRADRRGLGDWELIVVDNNSTDATGDVVSEFANRADFEVRYVFEGQQGLARARNAGLAATRRPVIAFTDDDCQVDPAWMRTILAAFAADPALAVLGGRVDLADPADQPVSIRPFDDPAEVRDAGGLFRWMTGCNMAFAKTVFERIGGFDPVFGAGTPIAGGEDTDLFYRALKRGYAIRYDPEVRVRHAHGRRTTADVTKLGHGYLRGKGAFYAKHISAGDRDMRRRAYWEVRGLLSLRARRSADGSGASRLGALASLAVGALLQLCARRTEGRR